MCILSSKKEIENIKDKWDLDKQKLSVTGQNTPNMVRH